MIFAAIARFLKSLGSDVWNARWDILRWCHNLIRAPFQMIFGSKPEPSYAPELQTSDLLDKLRSAREDAAERVIRLDRGGIEGVLEYCRAHRDDRTRMTLPNSLDRKVRAALLTMDDAELRTLAGAGIGQLRKFAAGLPHGIAGVPAFGERLPLAGNDAPPAGLNAHERMLWKVRAQLLKEGNADAFSRPKSL